MYLLLKNTSINFLKIKGFTFFFVDIYKLLALVNSGGILLERKVFDGNLS